MGEASESRLTYLATALLNEARLAVPDSMPGRVDRVSVDATGDTLTVSIAVVPLASMVELTLVSTTVEDEDGVESRPVPDGV